LTAKAKWSSLKTEKKIDKKAGKKVANKILHATLFFPWRLVAVFLDVASNDFAQTLKTRNERTTTRVNLVDSV
jgi:Zn-dependent M32 family carboxypeptidase